MKTLVVTPTLGTSPWLAETCASVAAHVLDSVHVLVAPADRIAELVLRFPRCMVVAEPSDGRGMYAAINAGVAARDDWGAMTYLNDDDLLLPRFASVVRSAVPAGQPLLAYGAVRLIDRVGKRLGLIPVSPRPAINRALYAQRLEPVYQHGTLVTRAAWEKLAGFDEAFRYCGDSEFLARACVMGIPSLRVSGEVAAFRLRAGQLTKNRAAMVAERTRVDDKLGLLGGVDGSQRFRARAIFRLANIAAYAERIARHGFVSFDELLTRGG